MDGWMDGWIDELDKQHEMVIPFSLQKILLLAFFVKSTKIYHLEAIWEILLK